MTENKSDEFDNPFKKVKRRFELDVRNTVESWQEIGLSDPLTTKTSLPALVESAYNCGKQVLAYPDSIMTPIHDLIQDPINEG